MKEFSAKTFTACVMAVVAMTSVVSFSAAASPPPERFPSVLADGHGAEDKLAQPTFNIDFGPDRKAPSKKTGAAAAGAPGDFWNSVAIGFNSNHIETGLKFANGQPSSIAAGLNNLGGGWGNCGKMRIDDPMMDDFDYPVNNQGGNSMVTLYNVAPGSYDIYLYGHGTSAQYYGDYTVMVGERNYGDKQTSHGLDAVENTKWVEGSQYVVFREVTVGKDDIVTVLIQPGGTVTDAGGRTFADAMICGLRLGPGEVGCGVEIDG